MVLSRFTVAMPWEGSDADVTVSVSLSESVSLASTSIVTGVFGGVLAESLLATGTWFTWSTVIDTVAAAAEST